MTLSRRFYTDWVVAMAIAKLSRYERSAHFLRVTGIIRLLHRFAFLSPSFSLFLLLFLLLSPPPLLFQFFLPPSSFLFPPFLTKRNCSRAARKREADPRLKQLSEEALAFVARSPSPVFGVAISGMVMVSETPEVFAMALKFLYERDGTHFLLLFFCHWNFLSTVLEPMIDPMREGVCVYRVYG